MKWITRENANVDRIACPWLIRRFIDKDAEFLFVPKEQVMPAAEGEGAIPYDVPGVELGHVEGRCSFESIMLKYGLDGRSCLDRDGKNHTRRGRVCRCRHVSARGRFESHSSRFAILHGLDDHKKIELETPMYDALYAWCKTQAESV